MLVLNNNPFVHACIYLQYFNSALSRGVCECKMDVKSTWIPTWHRVDCVSSLGLFVKNHLLEVRLTRKPGDHPNITQPKGLNSGAEFNAAPKRLHGGSDASSGGSIFLALAISAP